MRILEIFVWLEKEKRGWYYENLSSIFKHFRTIFVMVILSTRVVVNLQKCWNNVGR